MLARDVDSFVLVEVSPPAAFQRFQRLLCGGFAPFSDGFGLAVALSAAHCVVRTAFAVFLSTILHVFAGCGSISRGIAGSADDHSGKLVDFAGRNSVDAADSALTLSAGIVDRRYRLHLPERTALQLARAAGEGHSSAPQSDGHAGFASADRSFQPHAAR